MKKITSLFLLVIFTLQSFSQGIMLLDFYMHRSSIAATQCENRYRPMLHCNGQCVLAKKLKQQEKRDQQEPDRKLSGKQETISSRSFFYALTNSSALTSLKHLLFSDTRTIDRSFSVFHPPSLASR